MPAQMFERTIFRGGEQLTVPNMRARQLVSHMTGQSMGALEASGAWRRGLQFRRTGLLFGELSVAGEGGAILSRAAIPLRTGTASGGMMLDWWARVSGMNLGITQSVIREAEPAMMAVTAPGIDKVLKVPTSQTASRIFTKIRVAGRFQRAYWASQIGRLNRLLAQPFELIPGARKVPGLGRAMGGIGGLLAVKPGTATQMLGRYAGKGMAIGAGLTALSYLGYQRGKREAGVGTALMSGVVGGVAGLALGGLLKKAGLGALIGTAAGAIIGGAPLFDKGIFEGFASAYERAHVGYAQLSESTGLTEATREQERFMPGITKGRTLAGLTFGGGMLGWFGSALTKRLSFGKGMMIGAGVWSTFALAAGVATGHMPGIFGTEDSPEDLEAIYSGEKLVPVRKGRWWVFGRSPFTGGKVQYYRPHLLAMLKNKADVIGMYGSEEERWAQSAMLHPLKAMFDEEFKYRWERQHYKDRPYPITGAGPLSQVPFIGPALSGLDRLIKPRKLMHTDEWLRGGTLEGAQAGTGAVVRVPHAGEQEPAPELGGKTPGTPITRDDIKFKTGELIYRINELRGLTGFVHSAVKEHLTGSQDYFDKLEVLASPEYATSSTRRWWQMRLGDPGFCFVAGTPVVTETGRKPIEEVQVGDRVVSIDGKLKPVVSTLHKKSDDLYRIDIDTLDVTLTGTGTHHIPVYRPTFCRDSHSRPCIPNHKKYCKICRKSDKTIYPHNINLKDICPGDYVLLPIIRDEYDLVYDLARFYDVGTVTDQHIYWRASSNLVSALKLLKDDPTLSIKSLKARGYSYDIIQSARLHVKNKTEPRSFERYLHVDADMAYLMGWYVAKGSIESEGRISFALHEDEIDIGYKLIDIIRAKFGGVGSVIRQDNSRGIQVRINAVVLASLLVEIFGHSAENKRIPYEIKTLPKDILKRFFIALQKGDGWANIKKMKAGYGSISSQLCRDMLDVGLKLGLTGNLKVDYLEKSSGCYPQGTPRHDTVRSYVRWHKLAAATICEWLYGVKLNKNFRPSGKSFIDGNFYYVRVKNVQRIVGEEDVYDLQVNDTSYYIADHIAVHNTEALRRFLPHRRRQIPEYNPLANQMPDWLPGEEYFRNFRRGDPYTSIDYGEARLPGPGYEALHPHLKGVPASQYPLVDRYRILADVAMWSDKFKETRREVYKAKKRGELTDTQLSAIDEINRQIIEKKQYRQFQEYKFAKDALEKRTVTAGRQIAPGFFETSEGVIKLSGVDMAHEALSNANREVIGTPNYRKKQTQVADFLREHVAPGAEIDVYVHRNEAYKYQRGGPTGGYMSATIEAGGTNVGRALVEAELGAYPEEPTPYSTITEYGAGSRFMGRLWERITHFEPPTEQIIPFSPMAKFIHARSPIEEYERNRLLSSDIAMWQHPVEDFLKPAYQMTKAGLGSADVPEHVTKRWAIEDYFDKLKWLKSNMLQEMAEYVGDQEAAEELRKEKRRTMFGMNPYGSYSYIYSALPRADRDFFEEFKSAETQAEQKRILEMLPPNQRGLYKAQWQINLVKSLRAKKSAMAETDEADAHMREKIVESMQAEGRPVSEELYRQWRSETAGKQSYAEWSREKEIQDYFSQAPLPGANNVIWHPSVDLEDVKLKLVKNAGLDMHDFNLWPSRERTSAGKPYLEEAFEGVLAPEGSNGPAQREMAKTQIQAMLNPDKVHIYTVPVHSNEDAFELEINDDRRDVVMRFKENPEFMEMI